MNARMAAPLLLLLAACQPSPQQLPSAAPAPATASPAGAGPLAGRAMRCDTGGPTSTVVFRKDGRLTGRLMQAAITGQWRTSPGGHVLIDVKAGAVSLRDELKRQGNAWKGQTTTCRG